ncbi:hypothetical protein SMF1_0015 [Sulfolobales Mexican fusellovirus 1]|uniref:hypothetical protein n=1 Tax=Sulfolobales Mexican fusellovirus 1 TaxID=1298531 RepID=UPI0002C09EC8|nr:hypothetical protein SMF1_0015 [Sulfolobales Mexican fusellovirus 1]AGG36562.1 hypothetical protein SMF1_0015 [Sulfolobales Mexican fusellovirus 1]
MTMGGYLPEEVVAEAYVVRDYRRLEVNTLEVDVTDFTRYDYIMISHEGKTLVINCRNIIHALSTEDGKVEIRLPGETIYISREEGIRIVKEGEEGGEKK